LRWDNGEFVNSEIKSELYRKLPSVDELTKSLPELLAREGAPAVAAAARDVLERLRQEISAGRISAAGLDLAISRLADAVARQLLRSLQYSLRPVINATGVVLHTNLGRAPIAPAALERISRIAGGYTNLEFDIASGERGKRDVHADRLFAKLLGQQTAISTVVVNNCAAAVLLALNSLAEGGEVIVSRGELVEIGGGFRVPEVMAKAGALLREVGTTNRTRIADYEHAITEKTRILLRVHRSNFEMVGFTEQPKLEELVALGRKHKIPVIEDLGNGALLDLRSLGIAGEPGVVESLRAGVDVVAYSGDKLLGGPQAGMLSGRPEAIGRIRANPLFRALRVDKFTYAALEATLMAYIKQDHNAIPALRMLRLPVGEIRARAEAVRSTIENVTALKAEIVDGESVIGGGTAPSAKLPTALLVITHHTMNADSLAARLRAVEPPIVARIEDERVLLDLRTVFPEQDAAIAQALLRISQ
jgi:L-seryl-tRNA(Ser) seleniumtransferase